MEINSNFEERVVVKFRETDWSASPSAGVKRKMLDRLGGEIARATSIVQFQPGSTFAAHTHDGGEEYFVLDGVFQDELGDFPVGTYVRNPPTSRHTPATEPGATIFVKLHQFNPADRQEVRKGMDDAKVLFENNEERVEVQLLAPGENRKVDASGGAEIFVLDGMVTESNEALEEWDWLRLPVGGAGELTAGSAGARIWTKTGHLRARPPAAPLRD